MSLYAFALIMGNAVGFRIAGRIAGGDSVELLREEFGIRAAIQLAFFTPFSPSWDRGRGRRRRRWRSSDGTQENSLLYPPHRCRWPRRRAPRSLFPRLPQVETRRRYYSTDFHHHLAILGPRLSPSPQSNGEDR